MSVPHTGQRYRKLRKRWAEQRACDGCWDRYLRVKREGRAYDAGEYDFDCDGQYMEAGPACWDCFDWQECICPLLPDPLPLRVTFGEAMRIERAVRGAS